MSRIFVKILSVVFILIFSLNTYAVEKVKKLKVELGGDFSFSYEAFDRFGFDEGSGL